MGLHLKRRRKHNIRNMVISKRFDPLLLHLKSPDYNLMMVGIVLWICQFSQVVIISKTQSQIMFPFSSLAYIFSGSITHVILHDCIHGNVCKTRRGNDILGNILCLPFGFPAYFLDKPKHLALHGPNENAKPATTRKVFLNHVIPHLIFNGILYIFFGLKAFGFMLTLSVSLHQYQSTCSRQPTLLSDRLLHLHKKCPSIPITRLITFHYFLNL